jgi:hypothetical protein
MSKRKLLLLLIVIALMTCVGALTFYSFYLVQNTWTIPMEVNVSEQNGFNLDPGALRFGAVVAGNLARKGIYFNNQENYPVEIIIGLEGDIAQWVKVTNETYQFTLEPKESRNIEFSLKVPPETPLGGYSGTVRVMSKRKI